MSASMRAVSAFLGSLSAVHFLALALLCACAALVPLVYCLRSRRPAAAAALVAGAKATAPHGSPKVGEASSESDVEDEKHRLALSPSPSSLSAASFASPPAAAAAIGNIVTFTSIAPGSSPEKIPYNDPEGVAYTSPFVSGKIMILLRVDPPDPRFEFVFGKRKRYFELRFALTLHEKPKGLLYLGGELPRRMRLGLATDLMCRTILACLRRLASNMHCSFGDAEELPHICFPLWLAADRLILTKAGIGAPPNILQGEVLPESDKDRAARLKDPLFGANQLDAGDTVSFSVHSQFLDVLEWKLRNISGLNNQSLNVFWDEQPLHAVLYDVVDPKARHSESNKLYWAAFCIRNARREEPQEFDAVQLTPSLSASRRNDYEDPSDDFELAPPTSPPRRRSKHASSFSSRRLLSLFGGHRQTPLMVRGHFRVPAVLNEDLFILATTPAGALAGTPAKTVFAAYDWPTLARAFKLAALAPGAPKSPAEAQARRAQLDGFLLRQKQGASTSVALPKGHRLFSLESRWALSKLWAQPEDGVLVHECPVLRAVCETLFVEEWAVLLQKPAGLVVGFFRPGERLPSRELDVSARVDLRLRSGLFGHLALEMAMLSRVEVLGFEEGDRDVWARAISPQVRPDGALAQALDNEVFLDETMRWGGKRVVMNSRRLRLFDNTEPCAEQPCALSARLLREAVEVCGADDFAVSDRDGRDAVMAFLDHAGLLRGMDLLEHAESWTPAEQTSFFLNVYHTMLLHARWLIGQPMSVFRWGAFGSQVSYEFGWGPGGFAVLSLAEIEHRVLRAHRPRLFADILGGLEPRTVPSTAVTDLLRLRAADPRINFCLSHGCKAERRALTLFTPQALGQQMARAAQRFLDEFVHSEGRRVALPRICYWYWKDFIEAESADGKKLARALAAYAQGETKALLELAATNSGWEVKFQKFAWEPHDALLLEEEARGEARG